MAVTAAQTQELNALTQAYNDAFNKYNTDLQAAGGPPITQADLALYLQQTQQGGIAGTAAQLTKKPPGYAYWAGQSGGTLAADFNALLLAQEKDQQLASELYGSGTNFFSILPFLFVGALGATAAIEAGAATATAGGAAAAGSTAAESAPAITPILTGTTPEELAAGAAAVTTPIVTSTGSAVATAAASTGSLASSVGSAVTALTGSGTAGDIVSSVVSNIGSLISDVENILKPVTTLATNVLNDVETINKDYIIPITTTISQDYTTITGLIKEVDTLSQAGIQGILAIPSAIGSALTSIDAANQRLAQMNAQANQTIASQTLVPGIGGAISSPLSDIHGVLNDAFNQPVAEVGKLSVEPLNETDFAGFDPAQSQQAAIQQLGSIKVLGPIIVGILGVWKDILQFIGYLESWLSFSRQAGHLAQPIEPLGVGETIKAWWREQMQPADAVEELKRHGIEPTRAQLLYDLQQWLPGIADGVRMFYQGIITSEQLNAALAKQGLDPNDVQAVLDSAPARVDPREAITLNGRGAAASAGFLPGTLLQDCPDQFKLLYPPRIEDAARAPLDWQAHWNLMDIHWWITAYFRGVASESEVTLAAQAFNIAPEIIPNLIGIEAETIQLWMIPDMIATGLFDATSGAAYLKYIGIGDVDAQWIIKYGQSKANAGLATDALGLGNLSLGVAAEMYNDGIINQSEYVDILEAHHLTPEAAALYVKLTDQKNALSERRANADALVKQVDAGILDLATMQSQLYSGGYTQSEVNTYTAKANANLILKAKVPTEAEIKAFLAAGILDTDGAFAALQLAGWTQQWAAAFLTLWGAPNVPTPNA